LLTLSNLCTTARMRCWMCLVHLRCIAVMPTLLLGPSIIVLLLLLLLLLLVLLLLQMLLLLLLQHRFRWR